MYYIIIASDNEDSLERRSGARPDHLHRLDELRNEGRLLTAGPTPAIDSEDPGSAGYSGSIVIAEFDSLQAARCWADDDPYVAAGVYRDVVVKPYKRVY